MARQTISIVALTALVLASAPALAKKPVCGDGTADRAEQCDGADLKGFDCTNLGYSGGSLACLADCSYDTSGCIAHDCGDGVLADGEECDGGNDVACPGLCSAHCACPALSQSGNLELHVIDVGQGDAILVISPDGFVMLVDAGDDGDAPAIEAYLSSVGVGSLDYTLVSHMHADHVGGMDRVLADHPEVTACFDHGGSYDSSAFTEYAAAAGARHTIAAVGDTIDLGPSLQAQVLHGYDASSNENDNSVVLKITFGRNTFLLGGDCEAPCEASFNPGLIDVYKVHHHGSSTSSTESLLEQMGADLALISVGADNSYGHPTQETLDRLAAHGAQVQRTDLEGHLMVVADSVGYTINGLPICAEGALRSCGTSDVGACEYGQQQCQDQGWGDCLGEVGPVPEDCGNGVDDDCDGAVDDADRDCAPVAGHLLISQVAYDTPGIDAVEEFVDLYNPLSTAVPLQGWTLGDVIGTWTFPADAVIAAGSYLTVARDAAGFAAWFGMEPDLAGLTLSLGNTGDSLVLKDSAGLEVDYVAWEQPELGWSIAAGTGDAIERIDPTVDVDTVADWQVISPAAPRGGAVAPPPSSGCGDGVCSAGEDCLTCAQDCVGLQTGKPSGRYCCGNGSCEDVGETAANCAVDCG